MAVISDITELIGRTPLFHVTNFPLPKGVNLYAKLEMRNPGGSIKDRLGKKLIQDAFTSGKLAEGGTLIEATAGNTGIGLALCARKFGINVLLCVPEHFSQEKISLMKALGAQIIYTPRSEGMKGAIDKALELEREINGSYCVSQFKNRVNPSTYYDTIAPEIWEDLHGRIDIFVAGSGTGGTFTGTAQYLKEKNNQIKTVIVEPEGSILNGGIAGPHKTEGIGMEFIPEYMNPNHFDKIYTVNDKDAFRLVKEAAIKEGLLIGSSSGASLYAGLKEAEAAQPGTNIVTIFPDSSERYLSKSIYEGGI
ncbi:MULTISPECIES: PLP-dependent cysteine synthase family protein [Bacillus]|uniref:Cysteine synthase n=2 Tax=Bacillus TaxID=1386 RepID=A0A0M4FR06_9BACI|nr:MULTISPECIES: cysteine synthase family protein [Bacillus]ALC81785.1 cysteine synthase [Bacillus gobiensis]MBP1080887.1 O-acetylserine dependent cystathionine beta-synthase [Bacillus capparidis]MED1097526.1 cysteine synthase family protein [Bacillus capparidis]